MDTDCWLSTVFSAMQLFHVATEHLFMLYFMGLLSFINNNALEIICNLVPIIGKIEMVFINVYRHAT